MSVQRWAALHRKMNHPINNHNARVLGLWLLYPLSIQVTSQSPSHNVSVHHHPPFNISQDGLPCAGQKAALWGHQRVLKVTSSVWYPLQMGGQIALALTAHNLKISRAFWKTTDSCVTQACLSADVPDLVKDGQGSAEVGAGCLPGLELPVTLIRGSRGHLHWIWMREEGQHEQDTPDMTLTWLAAGQGEPSFHGIFYFDKYWHWRYSLWACVLGLLCILTWNYNTFGDTAENRVTGSFPTRWCPAALRDKVVRTWLPGPA